MKVFVVTANAQKDDVVEVFVLGVYATLSQAQQDWGAGGLWLDSGPGEWKLHDSTLTITQMPVEGAEVAWT